MRILQYALDIGEGQGPVGHFFPLLKSEVSTGEHPEFANISVGAKHDRSESFLLTNNLSAVMLRPYKIGMLPSTV